MRAPRLTPLAWVAGALVAGLALLGYDYGRHGVPRKVVEAVLSTRLGDRLAQAGLRATAPPAPPGVTVLGPGDRLPDWTLPDPSGAPQALTQWRGKRVVLNFWATWCQPCRKEMPALVAAQKRHAGDAVQILGIAMDAPAAVRGFLAQHRLDYPVLIGSALTPDPVVRLGDTRGALPFSVLVDARGRIVRTHLGALHTDQLDDWLRGPTTPPR